MKTKRYLMPMLALLMAMTGCVTFSEPTIEYDVIDWTPTHTIAEIKAMHPITNPSTAPVEIKGDYIIKAVVTADDYSGNIYKAIYLQDETGAINVALDQVNLYNYFPVGQTVFVKLKGLYVGDYRGLYQLGYVASDGTMGRWDFVWEIFMDATTNEKPYQHFFASGLPAPQNVPAPKVFTTANFTTADVCDLVTMENVYFPDAEYNLPFADKEANTNRTLMFEDGTSIIVRTSGYSNFYADLLTRGKGNVTGILSIFGSTYQLYIRDRADIDFPVQE